MNDKIGFRKFLFVLPQKVYPTLYMWQWWIYIGCSATSLKHACLNQTYLPILMLKITNVHLLKQVWFIHLYSEFIRSDSKSMLEYLVVIQELSGLQKISVGWKGKFQMHENQSVGQGLDWVVWPGYSFWVFLTSRFAPPPLSSVDDHGWPLEDHMFW